MNNEEHSQAHEVMKELLGDIPSQQEVLSQLQIGWEKKCLQQMELIFYNAVFSHFF